MTRALRFALALWMSGHAGADDFRPSYLQIDANLADEIDRELLALGYRCLHRSSDVANYGRTARLSVPCGSSVWRG